MSCTSNIHLNRHPYFVVFGYRNAQHIKKYIQQSKIVYNPHKNFTDDDMRRALLLLF